MKALFIIWTQFFWGMDWGEVNQGAWSLHGAEIRKTSTIRAPRAYTLLLNGANSYGLPYQVADSREQAAGDSVVSECISLSFYPVYVSFGYQRGGLMEPPEADDTLSLWALNAQGEWERIWYAVGAIQGDTTFNFITLPLADSKWYHSCFRLKWSVWGSTYGPYDNWHIAYTYIHSDTSFQRTLFWQSLPRVYGGEYGIWFPGAALRDSQVIACLGGEVGIASEARIWLNGSLLDSWSGNLTGEDTIRLRAPRPFSPGAYVIEWEASSFTGYLQRLRDVLFLGEHIWGYDDGEMEKGYGVRQAGIPFCQVFDLDSTESITRVGLRFFPVPTQYGKTFQLCIWKLSDGLTPLYAKYESVRVDSLGDWTWYAIDTPLALTGRIGVGFIQADNQPLGIGWDASCSKGELVWVGSMGVWTPSQIPGCMMLRIEKAPAIMGIFSESQRRSKVPAFLHVGEVFTLEGKGEGWVKVWDLTGREITTWQKGQVQQAPNQAGYYVWREDGGEGGHLVVVP
ncbi:MAG: hypothetical protein RMJ66_00055 [Bacteroidia bacterium]|nr:hypothetical protein [Bacteroidia bacterium]